MDLPNKTVLGGNVVLNQLVWFLYGPPGIGKSSLASGFRTGKSRPLFLWTSPITYIEGVYKKRISDWPTFKKTVKALKAKHPERYSVIVVDIIDFLFLHCRAHVLNHRGIEHESDLGHGKGFDMVKREFIPVIATLCTSGYGVVFISHAQSRDFQPGRGIKEQRIIPTLQGSAKNVILPICDIEGYLGFSPDDVEDDTGKRRIFFEPTGSVEAKDWTGRLPTRMTLDRNPVITCKKLETALLTEGREGGKKKKKTKRKKKA